MKTKKNTGPNREWQKDYSIERDHKSYSNEPIKKVKVIVKVKGK